MSPLQTLDSNTVVCSGHVDAHFVLVADFSRPICPSSAFSGRSGFTAIVRAASHHDENMEAYITSGLAVDIMR